MDRLDDIKKVWLTTTVSNLPESSDLIKTFKKFRLKLLIKNVGLILLILFLIGVMISVMFNYKSNQLSTRIGEICMILAALILLGSGTASYRRISGWRNCSNEQYIKLLKIEQLKLVSFQKSKQVIGFVIMMLCTYLFLAIWLAVCWFIIGPYSLKRKTLKLSETINKLEKLSAQLMNK
jgi:drug/metabolite transporter (DMT)-like permease